MIDFNTLLNYVTIHDVGLMLLIWVIGGVIFNLIRWRSIIKVGVTHSNGERRLVSPLKALGRTLGHDVLLQLDLRLCSSRKWISHVTVFWGFIILGLATTVNYLVNPTALPLSLSHPVRILGNIGGFLFIFGLTMMIYERASVPSSRRNTSRGDTFFIVLLYVVGLSGFMTEAASAINSTSMTFVTYWIHLILTAGLIIVAPFSKFVHLLGRALLKFLENMEKSASIVR